MKWKLKELQGEYQSRTGARLTYEDITRETGISSSTLSEIATGRQRRADLGTIERLLNMFADKLGRPVTTVDLLEYIPE